MATSGNALNDRRCRLTIASPSKTPGDYAGYVATDVVEIDGGKTDTTNKIGMRVRFKIEKSLEKEPNSSEILVTNLSESRRQSLQQKGVKVRLEAGYKATGLQTLFQGDVRSTDQVRNAADWDTTMKLGDGERSWKYARVYESFAPGTAASDVLKTLAKAMGLGLGNVNAKAAQIATVLDQGWVAIGSASRALDKLVVALGRTWSVQDGELQILDPYETLDLPIPEITPQTGLVGSPEMGTPGTKGKPALLRFKSLLIVAKPGSRVKLRSKRYDGFIRVIKVSYEGDSSGGEWYSTFDGEVTK